MNEDDIPQWQDLIDQLYAIADEKLESNIHDIRKALFVFALGEYPAIGNCYDSLVSAIRAQWTDSYRTRELRDFKDKISSIYDFKWREPHAK